MTNNRLPYYNYIRRAEMLFHGKVVGILQEESNDAGETCWVIIPDYNVIDTFEHFNAMSGVDLTLRLKEYIRDEVPAIVSERTVPDNRENIREELEAFGLDYNDRYEFMCRHGGHCGKNNILIRRLDELILNDDGTWSKVSVGYNEPTDEEKKRNGWG